MEVRCGETIVLSLTLIGRKLRQIEKIPTIRRVFAVAQTLSTSPVARPGANAAWLGHVLRTRRGISCEQRFGSTERVDEGAVQCCIA
jgi:hypothetical protein